MFEQLSDAQEQVLKDKHTLLEGYVVEYLYEKQFLLSSKIPYTSGWWSAETGNQRFFFLVSEASNEVDNAVMEVLSAHYPVWRAYPEGDTWYFYQGETALSLPQFLKMYDLPTPKAPIPADEKVRNYDRQMQCVQFFQTHGILRKIAIERHFANFFLAGCFESLVNIDYFIQKRSRQLCAIEVKFKNEIARENGPSTFGINVGQFRMFQLLEGLGFEIQHWILYKKIHNKKNVSIFDFLAQDGKKWWRFGEIHTADAIGPGRIAPEETSVNGYRKQEYYEFNAEHFVFKKPLHME